VDDLQRTFADFIERYGPSAGAEGPVLFVREVLGADPDEWQEDVLTDFGLGRRRIAIRSCHGPGKTCLLAWLVLYMLLFRFPQKTVATAPTRGQLFDGLFSEVLTWLHRLPQPIQDLYTVKSDRIELKASPAESFFTAKTARPETPEALQGIHSEHVLIIVDEASGVPEPIFQAGHGSMSGESCTTLMAGNPVRTSGFFFDAFHKAASLWKTYHIRSAFAEWPTGTGSTRVGQDFVDETALLYGEESAAFRIRVLGEFPTADDDTVIPYILVESARMRDIEELPNAKRVWGVDVARFGSARNSICVRTKRRVLELDSWKGVDLMKTAGRIKQKYDSTPQHQRPDSILIDVNGLGAGVVDRLYEQGLPVRGINVSESTNIGERFLRLRDELWWKGREWLEALDVSLPRNDKDPKSDIEILAGELVQPKYQYMSTGKIKVESKDEMRKRGIDSPDVGDAFILTMAEDAAALSGTNTGTSWGNVPWNEELPGRVTGVP
jgi:hypothetical protein